VAGVIYDGFSKNKYDKQGDPMSVLQSKESELRYLKRKNLEEEARFIGNCYRDQIRSYGVDCNYYKAKIPYMDVFKPIVDWNTRVLHAYGMDPNPDYSISAEMITFCEVQDDILQLNKIGVVPNVDVTFYFDSGDFACALASKLGQYKEYKVKNQEVVIEVPKSSDDYIEYQGPDGETARYYLSSDAFPYFHGVGCDEHFDTEIMSGKLSVALGPYEYGKEYTIQCDPYEHGDVSIKFPANEDLYASFDREITTDDYVETLLLLTYRVDKVMDVGGIERSILSGYLHGGVLFRDLTQMGKYRDLIHPEVGDIVTIDFPNDHSREQYEITECADRNLASDGISPLLHKYIWKCKARRYINCKENFPETNEDNERWKEGIELINNAEEKLHEDKTISMYDETADDDIYGGYEREPTVWDKEAVSKPKKREYQRIREGETISLHVFADGNSLETDGYELFYVVKGVGAVKLTLVETVDTIRENYVASGIDYIKSTNDALFFVNFDNRVQKLCEDPDITEGEIQLCLNSLLDTTIKTHEPNSDGEFFYKFSNSNTILISLEDNLYCRLGNKARKLIKLT
jgi:hypothetical protein